VLWLWHCWKVNNCSLWLCGVSNEFVASETSVKSPTQPTARWGFNAYVNKKLKSWSYPVVTIQVIMKILRRCTPVSEIASRRHLCLSSRHHLSVPHYQSSAVEPSLLQARWSGTLLPYSLWDPAISSHNFRQLLKTDFFNRYSAHSAQ